MQEKPSPRRTDVRIRPYSSVSRPTGLPFEPACARARLTSGRSGLRDVRWIAGVARMSAVVTASCWRAHECCRRRSPAVRVARVRFLYFATVVREHVRRVEFAAHDALIQSVGHGQIVQSDIDFRVQGPELGECVAQVAHQIWVDCDRQPAALSALASGDFAHEITDVRQNCSDTPVGPYAFCGQCAGPPA